MRASTVRRYLVADPVAPIATIGLVAVVAVALLLGGVRGGHFTLDTWTYYELSQNIFTDFQRVWTYRAFYFEQPYSIAYPPLFPLTIAIVDRLTGMAWGGTLVVNVLAFGAFAVCNAAISHALCGRRSVGLIATLACLAFLPILTELVGGRSHSLALLLVALEMLVLVKRQPLDLGSAAVLGFLSGLAVMTRFDFLLPAATLGLLILVWERRLGIVIVYGAALSIVLLPWVWFSLSHFGTIFASDSSWVAQSVSVGASQQDYVVPPGPRRLAGLGDIITKLYAERGAAAEMSRDFSKHLVPALGAVGISIIVYRIWWRTWPRMTLKPVPTAFYRPGMLIVIWATTFVSACLVNTPSVRYMSGLLWNIWILALTLAALSFDRVDPNITTRLGILVAVLLSGLGIGLGIYDGTKAHHFPAAQAVIRSDALAACLHSIGAKSDETVFFIDDEEAAGQFGAIAHWSAAIPPHNETMLTSDDYASLLQRFHVSFIAADGIVPGAAAVFRTGEPLRGCPFSVTRVHAG